MRTEVYARLDDTPARFYSQAENRIRRAIGRWSRRLRKVRVFLREHRGPSGSHGTRCRIVLETERARAIVTTGHGIDAEGALSAALDRAREGIRRREKRRIAKLRARSGRRHLPKVA